MSEAINGNVLTSARAARRDVVMFATEKGGLQFKTLSYLDVLLDNDIITQPQFECGQAFWSLRDTAFHFLQMKIGKYDYTPEEQDNLLEAIEDNRADEGMATEIFLALTRRLRQSHRNAINASCASLESTYLPMKMAIIWAYGVNTLESAFAGLERNYPKAKEEAEEKLKSACAHL